MITVSRGLVTALLAFALSACGSSKVTVHGTLTTHSPADPSIGLDCPSTFSSIVEHRGLTFRNQAGTIIGHATTTTATFSSRPSLEAGQLDCQWVAAFTAELPQADFYQIERDGDRALRWPPMPFDALKAHGFAMALVWPPGS